MYMFGYIGGAQGERKGFSGLVIDLCGMYASAQKSRGLVYGKVQEVAGLGLHFHCKLDFLSHI